ncbi:hypothetical protein [Mesorhizobium loti]|uniref:Pilus assembly protein n=1 Tax=Mesorhizobium loti R88b TaxID=935548 RepID=A0A6M7WHW0_RHILI|nr:hypothetical protein [Mesorhizobium loti]QKD00199.1 hypothetical protein EB235_00895 [Mesorhizobium loti R88b]
MPTTLSRFILALMLLPFLAIAAGAQALSLPELGNTLPGRTDVTYLDLAKMVIPDLTADKGGAYQGGLPIEMRHIEGADSGGSPPEASNLSNAEVLAIKSGGKDRLAVLFDLGDSPDSAEGYAVLALYDVTAKPKLLDAANVAVDRSTYFQKPGKLAISASDDILTIGSSHSNSNQNYMIASLIMVANDKLKLIDMIYMLDEHVCAFSRTQDIAFRAIAEGRRYAAIKVTVTDATGPTGDSCDEAPPKVASHQISVTYHWNKKRSRYIKDSKAFERLSAENAKRF